MIKAIHIYNYDSHSDDLYIIDSLIDTIISPLLVGMMIIWMAYRSHALSRLAQARKKLIPFSFQLRAFFLFFLSFLYLIMVIFTCTTHFLIFDYEDPFSIITSGLMVIIFIWEVILLRFEFLKGVPFFFVHKVFWMIFFLISTANVALDFIVKEGFYFNKGLDFLTEL